MSSLPSTSTRRAPCARVMNSGEAPTDLNARTGLFTPPGRMSCARAKSCFDLVWRIFDEWVSAVYLDRRHCYAAGKGTIRSRANSSGVRQRCGNCLLRKRRVVGEQLIRRDAGREIVEHNRYRDPRAAKPGPAVQGVWRGDDVFLPAHGCPRGRVYAWARASANEKPSPMNVPFFCRISIGRRYLSSRRVTKNCSIRANAGAYAGVSEEVCWKMSRRSLERRRARSR